MNDSEKLERAKEELRFLVNKYSLGLSENNRYLFGLELSVFVFGLVDN